MLLPYALQAGLTYSDFWNMTLKEINSVIEGYTSILQNKVKEDKAKNYNLAYMISLLVNEGLSGKKLTSFDELFPDSNPDKESDYNKMLFQREMWIDFANQHNSIYKDGRSL